ncbi:MAG: hypothetical protein JWM57_792 [Phycisphaerales bacterium]|nr:hypothetical protein [Phycisphaerales bacterium]
MDLSPSLAHAAALRSIKPKLAYAGQPLRPWQRKVRSALRDLLKLDVITPAPLRPKSIWKRPHALGTIEKIAFTAEKGADVVAYWCTPHETPAATFICLQGHGSGIYTSLGLADDEQTPVADTHNLFFAEHCLKRNIAALCVEQRSFGLRRELVQKRRSDRSCREAVVRGLTIGRVLNGERVFDVMRAIDWLEQRKGVELTRLGILGHSSGGMTAMYAAALDERLKLAMLSCSVARFADSIITIGHCECNAVPGIYTQLEMADILAAIAPRPLVIVNGREDPIFPLASARKVFGTVRRAYTAAGVKADVRLIEGDGGHRYFEDAGWAAMLPLIRSTLN